MIEDHTNQTSDLQNHDQRDYQLRIQSFYLTPTELQQEADLASSLIAQFDSYQGKIREMMEYIDIQNQEKTYQILNFLSRMWRRVTSSVGAIKLPEYNETDDIKRSITKMARWESIYKNGFKNILKIETDLVFHFPILTNNAKQVMNLLNNIVNNKLMITIGLKDLIVLVKDIVNLNNLEDSAGVKSLILTALLENDDVESGAYFISSGKLAQISKLLKEKKSCDLICNKLDIDVDIVKNAVMQRVKKQKSMLNTNTKNYNSVRRQFEELKNEYATDAGNPLKQCEAALKIQIAYANTVNTYRNFFKANDQQTQPSQKIVLSIEQPFTTKLIQKIGKQDFSLSLQTQISVVLAQIKQNYFKDVKQIYDIKHLANDTFIIEGDSKGWILRWMKKDQKFTYSSKPQEKEQKTLMILKLESEKKREIFKEGMATFYKMLENEQVYEDFNIYNSKIYELFIYEQAGMGMKKINEMKKEGIINKQIKIT